MVDLKDYIDEYYPDEELVMYDGFDEAFIGIGYSFNKSFVCYSHKRMVGLLIRDGCMSSEEAHEYIDFNIGGSYIGPNTPIIVEDDF